MADGIIRPTTEEHIEHLKKFREKTLKLRAEGNGKEEAFYEEYGLTGVLDYYRYEMVKHGILENESDW